MMMRFHTDLGLDVSVAGSNAIKLCQKSLLVLHYPIKL